MHAGDPGGRHRQERVHVALRSPALARCAPAAAGRHDRRAFDLVGGTDGPKWRLPERLHNRHRRRAVVGCRHHHHRGTWRVPAALAPERPCAVPPGSTRAHGGFCHALTAAAALCGAGVAPEERGKSPPTTRSPATRPSSHATASSSRSARWHDVYPPRFGPPPSVAYSSANPGAALQRCRRRRRPLLAADVAAPAPTSSPCRSSQSSECDLGIRAVRALAGASRAPRRLSAGRGFLVAALPRAHPTPAAVPPPRATL